MRQYGWQGGRWRGKKKGLEEERSGGGQGCQGPAEGRQAYASGSHGGEEAARRGRYAAVAEAEALKLQARLEDLTVREMEEGQADPEGL
jgi:hypothetical protein